MLRLLSPVLTRRREEGEGGLGDEGNPFAGTG